MLNEHKNEFGVTSNTKYLFMVMRILTLKVLFRHIQCFTSGAPTGHDASSSDTRSMVSTISHQFGGIESDASMAYDLVEVTKMT